MEKSLILPRRFVSLSFLELPSVNDTEIRDMLECRVAGMILCSRQDIIMGYRNMGFFRNGFSHVMLAVATKSLVEDMAGERAKDIEAVLLETELWYLYMLARHMLSCDKKILAIDIKDEHAELMVVDRIRPVFSMSFRYGDLFLKGLGHSLDIVGLDEVVVTYRGKIDTGKFKAVMEDYSDAPLNFYEREEGIALEERRGGFEPAINLLKRDTIEEANRKNLLVTFILLLGITLISVAIFIF